MRCIARNPLLLSVLDAPKCNVLLLQADSRVKDRDLPDKLNSTLIHIDSKILPLTIASGVI
ncbi:MAG: hypothetical protein V7L12_25945 [Nostoc sp.]